MEWTQLLAGGGALGGVAGLVVLAPRVWRPVRRLVATVDVLAGRPERYPGDPEARPGLVEALDHLQRHVGNGSDVPLRSLVEDHGRRLARVERSLGTEGEQ